MVSISGVVVFWSGSKKHLPRYNSGSPQVEIRRFYRATELPRAVEDFIPPNADGEQREEVFESDDVIDRIPASHLLGNECRCIYLGHHVRTANVKTGR
jgi:hypothetical protein